MAHVPLIFKNRISEWPAKKWTPSCLEEIFQNKLLKFRIGKRKHTAGVQLETQCHYAEATISHFMAWLDGKLEHSNPLRPFPCQDWWCYADYKHMQQLFESRPEVLKAIDWSSFGCDGKDGKDSTFWLGSKDAYTVCHYDTYGCNLVAQLYGRKRWVLFPPEETASLYPTRIPYEESSVFSQVNILQPDLRKHPLFQKSEPYVVTLEPGDVLFVPRHWWHFVHNLETSISINMWIDMPCDHEERVREAITKTMLFSLMEEEAEDIGTWLNPTELDNIPDLTQIWTENLTLLNNSLQAHQQHTDATTTSTSSSNEPTQSRKRKAPDLDHAGEGDSKANTLSQKKLKLGAGQEQGKMLPKQPDMTIQDRISQLKNGCVIPKIPFFEYFKDTMCSKPMARSTRKQALQQTKAPSSPSSSPARGGKQPSLDLVTSVSGLCSMTEELDMGSREDSGGVRLSVSDLVDCVVDPEVVCLIQRKVEAKYKQLQAQRS